MIDSIVVGSSPNDESCVLVNKDIPYLNEMKEECNRFKAGLEHYFEELFKIGIYLRVKQFSHDFGPYCEVVVFYDTDSEKQVEAALEIEENTPNTWKELEESKYKKKANNNG